MFPCARALDPRGKTLIATRALFWLKMGRRYCIVSVSCTSYTFALFSIKTIHFFPRQSSIDVLSRRGCVLLATIGGMSLFLPPRRARRRAARSPHGFAARGGRLAQQQAHLLRVRRDDVVGAHLADVSLWRSGSPLRCSSPWRRQEAAEALGRAVGRWRPIPARGERAPTHGPLDLVAHMLSWLASVCRR